MKAGLMALAWWLSCCTVAAAEDYCAQLQGEGLEGRLVTINITGGTGKAYIEGRLFAVKPGVLVLELSGSRAYVNCANISSLVVAGTGAQSGDLSDTIGQIWKAFGD